MSCAGIALSDPPVGYQFVSFDEARTRAGNSGKPVFVYFGREGCGYCELTNVKGFARPEVRKRFHEHFEMTYLDAEGGKRITLPGGERLTEAEYGTRLRTFVTPVFVFLTPDGVEALRRVGFQSAEDLLNAARYVHEKLYMIMSYDVFMKQNINKKSGS